VKKILAVLFSLLAVLVFVPTIQNVSAETLKVKVSVSSCAILDAPLNEANTIYTASFGDELEVLGTAQTGELSFYQVKIPGSEQNGWVLKNAVSASNSKALEKSLDPNAKTLNKDVKVYSTQKLEKGSEIIIAGKPVLLSQFQEVKIVGGYNKNSDSTKIMFEYENQILTGYVKTSDLVVEGFNGTIILIVFIFILVVSIIVSIIVATKKKRKKAKNKT